MKEGECRRFINDFEYEMNMIRDDRCVLEHSTRRYSIPIILYPRSIGEESKYVTEYHHFMGKYNFQAKVSVKKHENFILSEGRVKLLKLVDKYGSIKQAAAELGMSYRHAWGIINKINTSLGVEAVSSRRGGSEGGKTIVTDVGKNLIHEYEGRKKAIDIIMKFGPRPAITVDGIIVRDGNVLLIKRRNPPYKGSFALPGGFVEFKEPVEDAVLREVSEETGLKTEIKSFIGVYSAPDRDPRGHTISVVYELKVTGGKVKAGSDATDLGWFKLKDMPELAFDHLEIMNDYKRMNKIK